MLTERQETILAYIRQYIEAHGYPPTLREIGRDCGISSTSVVAYNRDVLMRCGYVQRDSQVSRGLRLTELGAAVAR